MQLPIRNWRDRLNILRQDCKFRYVPFRAYYKYRAHKIMRRSDPEMALLPFLCDRKRISLDVGANLGLFTYPMSRYSAHVHAYEPNPFPLRVLKYVVDDNVTVHHMGLSDTSGEIEFVVPETYKGWSSNGASINDKTKDEGAFSFPLSVMRIDDLDLPEIGFIKIDVEGHEKQVIDGALETLARDRPNILLENEHIHMGDAFFTVFETLKDAGYHGYFMENGTLRHLSHFSIEAHQLAFSRGDKTPGVGYVRNFALLPQKI
jgi:FkbM family methyltransferase